jgi:hypothetical protein
MAKIPPPDPAMLDVSLEELYEDLGRYGAGGLVCVAAWWRNEAVEARSNREQALYLAERITRAQDRDWDQGKVVAWAEEVVRLLERL